MPSFYASSICVCNIDCQKSIQDIVLQSFIDLHNNILIVSLKEFQFFQRGFEGFIPSSIISTHHPLQPKKRRSKIDSKWRNVEKPSGHPTYHHAWKNATHGFIIAKG
jgi:hypothetical protein